MTDNSINVGKMTVKDFLSSGRNDPFVIPEYQRPYSWTEDQVNDLFNGLNDFMPSINNKEYFLGCVVLQTNDGEQKLIDGQQRTTTLMLLLRALYAALETAYNNNSTDVETRGKCEHQMKEIEPAIWFTNEEDGRPDKTNPLLVSKAVDDKYNLTFRNILTTGVATEKDQDNYSKNYITLQKCIEEELMRNLTLIPFCVKLLKKAVIFPIRANNEETGLNIFYTLNALGMKLQDADIFKALIIQHKSEQDRKLFVDRWNQIVEDAKLIKLDMQGLLTYHMFRLKKDADTTLKSLRRFYKEDEQGENAELYKTDLLDNLQGMLKMLSVAYRSAKLPLEGEKWTENKTILSALDILRYYPNEYWKYPTLIYYMTHKDKEEFEDKFNLFLHQLIGELLKNFCVHHSINKIKGKVLKLNLEIKNTMHPVVDFETEINDELRNGIMYPQKSIRNMLIAALAYTQQEDLLPKKWEVEHIFPQSWKGYRNVEDEQALITNIDAIGNYLPLEDVRNIKATDHYFDFKKREYIKSNIAIVKKMAASTLQNWDVENIKMRTVESTNQLLECFQIWNKAYNEVSD